MTDTSIEAFWADFERQTGEPVLCRTMGQMFSAPKDRGDWGLLVLSPTSFRFRKTPGENWFVSVFKASAPVVPRQQEEDMIIPYTAMLDIKPAKKTIVDILFGSPFISFSLIYTKGDETIQVHFAVDPKSDFLSRLKELSKL